MHCESKHSKGEVHEMEDQISIWQQPVNIAFKRTTISNITNYKYCFDNYLKI